MSVIGELRKKEIEYCRDNLLYFVDSYGHIEDKDNLDSIIQPFAMWEEQRKTLNSIRDNKFNIILKARQLGFSWLVLHYAAWLMLCFEGRTVIGLSQKEDDAKELVRRLSQVILANIPELICEEKKAPIGWNGPVYTYNQLEIKIKFPSGLTSVFTGMPSSPGAGRSWTANLIILDEWAFQPFAEEIWKSGFPTVNRPTGGQVIGLSTIERGSFFETTFTDPDNGFNKIFIPWYADPRRDAAWYERTKQAMGDAITQEYPATIEEALTVPGGAYFPEVNKKNTVSKERIDKDGRNVVRYVTLDYGLDMLSAHWIMVDHLGNAQIYKSYNSPNKTISEAAGIILGMIDEDEYITDFLAPPDLWNRRQETGKSAAHIFGECGVNLTKTSNDMLAGCLSMKEWLKPQEDRQSKLTILDGAADYLYKCLTKIQKDKNKPNIYAKQPHDITHACLDGDTIVKTVDGDFCIKDLVGKSGYVYCKDKRGKIDIQKYFDVSMTRPTADLYEIELEDGTIIKATADHKIWTSNGFKTVSELNEQDEVFQFSSASATRWHTLCYHILSVLNTCYKHIVDHKLSKP